MPNFFGSPGENGIFNFSPSFHIFHSTIHYPHGSKPCILKNFASALRTRGKGDRSRHRSRRKRIPSAKFFTDAIRCETKLNAEIEENFLSTQFFHLGNIAWRTGRTIHFDPAKGAIVEDTGVAAGISAGMGAAGLKQQDRRQS
jgi:hypothetical protein